MKSFWEGFEKVAKRKYIGKPKKDGSGRARSKMKKQPIGACGEPKRKPQPIEGRNRFRPWTKI